jgi:uncharacterized membrane protein YqiK
MSVISIQSGASDDEFEEVEIPSAHAAYSQDEDVEQSYLTEEEEEEARVIRLEIGGSAPTEEEQARARALALRKWVNYRTL